MRTSITAALAVLVLSGIGTTTFVSPANALSETTSQTSAAATSSISFKDIARSPFKAEITWLANEGITTGWSDGTFRPAQKVTRDQMAAFLYRMAGKPAYTAPATSPFKDVKTTDPFYKEIAWLASEGISNGWASSGKPVFKPHASITRDQMAAFLYRYAGEPEYFQPKTPAFKDVRVGAPFYKEIHWLKDQKISNGWVSSTGKPTFRSAAPVTRETMAAFLYRLDGNLSGTTPTSPPAAQGEKRTGFITGYTIHDNDPAGSTEIAYSKDWNNATIHSKAGGTGTYDNPITLAAQVGDYAPGTRFYLPHVDRYFILEDTCASCGQKDEWIDMWIGGQMTDSATATDACARALTGTFEFIVNPARGLPVTEGSLFNSKTDKCAVPTP